jgi:hypothetical protein
MKTLRTITAATATLCIVACQHGSMLYVADSSGRLQKIGPTEWNLVSPKVSVEVDGNFLDCDLSPLSATEIYGHRNPHIHLKVGQHDQIFSAQAGASLFSGGGQSSFGASVSKQNASLTLDTLPAEAKKHFTKRFAPGEVHSTVIAGRRWIVTTQFEDPAKARLHNRTYWTIENNLLITFNLNVEPDGSQPAQWKEERIQRLEKVIANVRIRH